MKTQGDRFKKAIQALVPVMALAIALHSPGVLADGLDLNTVCGPTLNAPQASASPTPSATDNPVADATQQKLQYCQAAKSADDGADADSAMWKVWGAVGVICTYACVASFVDGPTSQFLCMGASLGGGITDAIVTKNFTSALMAVGGVAAGFAVNSAVNGGKEAAKEGAVQGKEAPKEGAKKQDKDIGACLNAAMAVMQAFMKYKSMQDNQSTEQTNLASANAVQAPTGTAADAGAGFQQALGSTGVGTNGTSGNGGLNNGPTSSGTTVAAGNTSSSCSGLAGNTSSSGSAIMQCAVASDKNLPGFVTNPKFPEEFQKDSGKSLASFLGGDGSPSAQMAGAMSNGMNASQSSTIASAVDGVQQYVGNSEGAAMYAGGGGGGGDGGGGDNGAASMAAMAQGLMDQLNPNKKKQAAVTGVNAVIFANQNRTPAAVAEDRKLSIFDRITYRYYFVGRRIVLGEGEK